MPERLLKVSCILFNKAKMVYHRRITQEGTLEVLNKVLPLLRLSSNSKKRLTQQPYSAAYRQHP